MIPSTSTLTIYNKNVIFSLRKGNQMVRRKKSPVASKDFQGSLKPSPDRSQRLGLAKNKLQESGLLVKEIGEPDNDYC